MSSYKGFVVALVAAIVLFAFGFSGCKSETPKYEMTDVDASIVKITGNPNVREEAILHNRDENNALGNVSEDGFTIQVNGLKEADIDFNNGAFYGFKVEDIISQPEGTWFPSKISKDSDGIVWINHKYVQILY